MFHEVTIYKKEYRELVTIKEKYEALTGYLYATARPTFEKDGLLFDTFLSPIMQALDPERYSKALDALKEDKDGLDNTER